MTDLKIPAGISAKGRAAAKVILSTAREACDRDLATGGCRAFYSPAEWEDRGEEYGTKSLLIVVHDGGDLARFFNHDYQAYDSIAKMQTALKGLGLYAESCTCWYSAVYPIA